MNKKLKSNDESLLNLINKITFTSNNTFIFGQRDSSSSYFLLMMSLVSLLVQVRLISFQMWEG